MTLRKSGIRFALIASACAIILPGPGGVGLGATNGHDEPPKLRPPRGEMPPSYWEKNHRLILILTPAAVIGLGLLGWYFCRPKPAVEVPAEVEARRELAALAGKPADRDTMSRASQVIKRFLAKIFLLGGNEMTTSEFCRAMDAKSEIGPALAAETCRFLKEADAAKFSPGSTQNDFVARALKLVETTEARRAELRRVQPGTATARAEERPKA
jgi:hypothetical protein